MMNVRCCRLDAMRAKTQQQGRHRNGEQAARRPHTMCSICGSQFTAPLLGERGDRDEFIR